jgi:hypothetical protein
VCVRERVSESVCVHSGAIGMTASEPAELVLTRLKAERDDPLELLVKKSKKG